MNCPISRTFKVQLPKGSYLRGDGQQTTVYGQDGQRYYCYLHSRGTVVESSAFYPYISVTYWMGEDDEN